MNSRGGGGNISLWHEGKLSFLVSTQIKRQTVCVLDMCSVHHMVMSCVCHNFRCTVYRQLCVFRRAKSKHLLGALDRAISSRVYIWPCLPIVYRVIALLSAPNSRFAFVSAAVKFGDALSPPKCSALLQQLSRCQAPYQCAHGRPAQAPIVDLDKLAQVSFSTTTCYPAQWLSDIVTVLIRNL